MSTVGKRIKRLREQQAKTSKDLAEAIGVPVSTYRDWEYGRSIRGEFYLPLSRALGVSVYELLTGEKPRRADVLDQIGDIEKRVSALKKILESLLF